MKISLAIANYNRHNMVVESFIQVMDNDLVDEIIILDDFSDIAEYCKLWNLIDLLNTNKVLLYRNAENVGPFLNKYRAVKQCKNDWIILLDNDNIIDNDYLEKVNKLNKEDDTIYCPEVMYKLNKEGINWTYKEFNHLIIDKSNAKNHIENSVFGTWMNTGNYFFNKKKYEEVVEQFDKGSELNALDSFYTNYLWLLAGNKIRIVPDLYYIHRVHDGSYYLNNKKQLRLIYTKIKDKIKLL